MIILIFPMHLKKLLVSSQYIGLCQRAQFPMSKVLKLGLGGKIRASSKTKWSS